MPVRHRLPRLRPAPRLSAPASAPALSAAIFAVAVTTGGPVPEYLLLLLPQ